MNLGMHEEIAASVGAHRDLGAAYDGAIAAGLVERIGAEVDRRVDERLSQHQLGDRPPAGYPGADAPAGGRHPRRRPLRSGGQVSWPQAFLAFGSMMIGAITTGNIADHATGTWAILVTWLAIVGINLAASRARRPQD